jgi:hypothetical protein
MNIRNSLHGKRWSRSAIAAAVGLCLAGAVMAQSTSGGINGTVKAGTVIVITNNSGLTRTITADSTGHFNFSQLPIGDYAVEAKGIGRRTVTVTVGSNANISFADALESVTITGKKTLIDTSATDTRTVITAKELSRLPLAQSAQAIALLAPGANAGAGGYFGDLVSFGGAGVSENAYYINGYFSGEPLSNLGQLELPYGAIAQQETYTGGYSAKYGRSDGGVINQVGKSGSNKFEFGGQATITPKALRSKAKDTYYPNITLPSNYGYANVDLPGTIYKRASEDTKSDQKYSAYVGGPLIKDKLFGFFALENDTTKQNYHPATTYGYDTHYSTKDTKAYLKLNWNITDDHLLEYTYMGERYDQRGDNYYYSTSTNTESGRYTSDATPELRNTRYNILKYTGYLRDDLTLTATYGGSKYGMQEIPKTVAGAPYISGTQYENTSLTGGKTIYSQNSDYLARDGKDHSNGLRADLEWKVNKSHTLSFGLDNINFSASNEGDSQIADAWVYRRKSSSGNISSALGVGNPYSSTNPDGYYVYKLDYHNNTTMSLEQKAYYLEDSWSVVKDLKLSLGVRNDRFTNKNDAGQTYMDAKNQWAPRIGAAWDVNGDASLKVFGNAGRYFLAMPNNVAIRGASASTYTTEYFTYTGIDANGTPTGLTAVPGVNGAAAPGAVSANMELGKAVDVASFAPKDLKNMYQDEFILGFEKALTKGWTAGAKFTHRQLKSAIDDFCDTGTLTAAAGLSYTGTDYSEGKYVYQNSEGKQYYVSGCYMFNPGGSNTYSFAAVDGSGRYEKKISSSELGFTEGVKRTYNAIDLFLERAFDNVWSLRVDYTYSKLKGNTEGQVKSNTGQDNISKTSDWDAAALMQYANGYLSNDRRHQLKVRGSYQFAQEWIAMANTSVLSGTPVTCTGYYSANGTAEDSDAGDPVGYGSDYHTCFGSAANPGKIRTPWTYKIDLGLQYRPNAYQGKLAFTANVFNVTNQRKVTQYNGTSETAAYTVSNTYMLPISSQTPRYWQFQVSYDY